MRQDIRESKYKEEEQFVNMNDSNDILTLAEYTRLDEATQSMYNSRMVSQDLAVSQMVTAFNQNIKSIVNKLNDIKAANISVPESIEISLEDSDQYANNTIEGRCGSVKARLNESKRELDELKYEPFTVSVIDDDESTTENDSSGLPPWLISNQKGEHEAVVLRVVTFLIPRDDTANNTEYAM